MSSTKEKDIIEEIKEIIKNLGESHEKAKVEMQEIRETQREVAESQKITDKALRRLERSLDKTNNRFNDKWGKFVENLIHGDLVKLLQGRDMKVIRIQPNMTYPPFKDNPRGEFDLVAVNGNELVIIEVKSTLEKADIHRFIKKLKFFKEAPTGYEGKKVFGGVAYLEVIKRANEYAEEEGLFVIKAPGGESQVSTIINAKNFKPKEF